MTAITLNSAGERLNSRFRLRMTGQRLAANNKARERSGNRYKAAEKRGNRRKNLVKPYYEVEFYQYFQAIMLCKVHLLNE